eukprot:TRINITY_DN1889_c0_g1_i1.p2 TRINITY_DN1889_c0_g1~~TRINITY_DN1889_c0_g1_i1.p2  ORF type:complete len:102 (+),score=41.84 TRINITY_DN1889_c0_g1_i1:681-986(+)
MCRGARRKRKTMNTIQQYNRFSMAKSNSQRKFQDMLGLKTRQNDGGFALRKEKNVKLSASSGVREVDLIRKYIHIMYSNHPKKKKYRLRGRSSETAKAHRG